MRDDELRAFERALEAGDLGELRRLGGRVAALARGHVEATDCIQRLQHHLPGDSRGSLGTSFSPPNVVRVGVLELHGFELDLGAMRPEDAFAEVRVDRRRGQDEIILTLRPLSRERAMSPD